MGLNAIALYPPATSLIHCAYFHLSREPRGEFVLLISSTSYVAFALQRYLLTGLLVHSLIYATGSIAFHVLYIILATVAYRLSPFHPLASFPGPILNKITSLKLARVAYLGQRNSYAVEMHQRYGVIVRTGPNKLSINSLEGIGPIYSSAQAFPKSEGYRPGSSSDGAIFFMRDKTRHHARRRIWAGAFTQNAMQHWDDDLKKRTDQLMECVASRRDEHGAVDLKLCIEHWAFDFMCDFIFGVGCSDIEFMQDGDSDKIVESSQDAIIMYESFGEVPALFDIMSRLPATADYQAMEHFVARLLKKRETTTPKNNWDLCSFLQGQRDDHPYPPIEGDDLQADALFAIEAGADTSAAILTITTFFLLYGSRSTYDKLTAELDQAFPMGEVTAEQHASLFDLPYLTAVVNEGLRLGAAFPGWPRTVPEGGVVIEGQYIPEGIIVSVPSYAQQMSPDNFWPATEEFRPERWFKDGLGPGTVTRRAADMSFQFGPWGCLGKSVALREMYVLIAYMLLSYDLHFAPDFKPKMFLDGWSNTRTNVLKYHLMVEAKTRQ